MSAGHHPATACSGSDRFIHGIRTSPAEAARWTLSCHSLCGKSCTCFSGILSVRRQRRLCSLSAAAGRGSRETACWGSGSPAGELWAGGKCKGRELCFSDAASCLGVPDPVGVWTLVCVPEKYREHRQTKRCTDNSPCFCGSHSIYHRDHQRGGGPLLLFHGMVRSSCSGSGDGGSYVGRTAGVRWSDLNGRSAVRGAESEIHLL